MEENKKNKIPNVPTLRFNSFTSSYVRTKLSRHLKTNPERNKNKFFSKYDVLSVSGEIGVVNQIKHLGRSYAGESVAPYHILKVGQIVYTKSPLAESPYGIIKLNRFEDGIVSTLYAVYDVLNNSDGKYIEHYFSYKPRLNNYLRPIVRIGAKHDMKIGNDEVLDNYVYFPEKSEQEKIAQFLDFLDERISTQNKIIEKYKSLIKPLFETLNSNTNINIAIKELGPYVSADLLSWNDMNHVGEPAIIYGQLFTDYKYIIEKVISKTERKIKTKTKDNDLLFPSSTTVDSLSLIAPSSIKIPGVIIGGDMFKIELDKEKFDSDYISFLINCSLNKKIAKYAQGSTIIHLHYEDIKLFQMKICGIEKQKEISKQMKVLLEKISVERSIMELLLKQKKYFLANLFI